MTKSSKMLTTTAALAVTATLTGGILNHNKVVLAQNVSKVNVVQKNTMQESILSTQIFVARSWMRNYAGSVLSFNTKNMTLNANIVAPAIATAVSAGYFSSNSPYVKYKLLSPSLQSQGEFYSTMEGKTSTIGGSWTNKKFSYGDILEFTSYPAVNAGIKTRNNSQYYQTFNDLSLSVPASYDNTTQYYFKITKDGLIKLNGLYTASNGNIYYFENGQMLKNIWVNVNAQGERTNDTVNGTTINAYYLGNNGIALKGLQKILGSWQYLNPTTGQMELNKFITVDGNTYYLQPVTGQAAVGLQTIGGKKYYFNSQTGVMETGWQTIGRKKYYFNSQTGVMETGWQTIDGSKYYFDANGQAVTGFQKIDNKVYNFANDGKLINVISISLNGVNNKTINVGEKFNPLEGVTLNDPADPTAKINVSGIVNSSIPGVYQLIYTVTDKYNQKITVIREITVKSASNLSSNTQALYWSQDNLVINGNLSDENTIFDKSTVKKLVIVNQDGQIVSSINTIPTNWYSKNQNNYSGFQGIISPSILSELKENTNYKFYIEINGNYIPLISNLSNPYNKNYLLSVTSSNQLSISKNNSSMQIVKEGIGNYKVGYFINNGYVINGNVLLNNDIFSKGDTKILVLKNSNGQVIDKVNTAAINWYSLNQNNYSGFQAIIPNSVLNKLKIGENYNLSLEVIKNNKVYEMPINNTEGFILNSGLNYNISTNSQNNIIITKNEQYPVINSGSSSLASGYWQSYGYVMNIKFNIEKNIPKGTKVELISKNLNNQVVSVTPGINVNWYSPNKNNYNGFQAMITPKQLVEASTSNKLYIRVTIDGKTYESPLTGNIDTFGSGNLNYGFKTINNQVHLIMK
mgnify:CR=1 FL=1